MVYQCGNFVTIFSPSFLFWIYAGIWVDDSTTSEDLASFIEKPIENAF